MSLTIQNETDWDGRGLRTLCRRVIEHTDGRFRRRIQIATSRSRGKDRMWKAGDRWSDEDGKCSTVRRMYRGRASINSTRKCYMGVPKPHRVIDGEVIEHEFDPVMFARVLEHELAHQRGLRHGDMIDSIRYCQQDIDYADELPEVTTKPSYEPPTA